MITKRITLFAGHYGSGKTNLAVNYAIKLRKEGKEVKIADMDIVNPYFRTKDSEEELKREGIRLISPQYANTNVDLPALPSEIYSLVRDKSTYAVMDIGGDDRGAYALGRYAPDILAEGNYEMIFVANFFRPLTETAEEALEVMREIEVAGKVPFTAIINNSNLGEQTTWDDVASTLLKAQKLAELSGLPVLFTSMTEPVLSRAEDSGFDGEVFKLNLQKKYF